MFSAQLHDFFGRRQPGIFLVSIVTSFNLWIRRLSVNQSTRRTLEVFTSQHLPPESSPIIAGCLSIHFIMMQWYGSGIEASVVTQSPDSQVPPLTAINMVIDNVDLGDAQTTLTLSSLSVCSQSTWCLSIYHTN